MSKYYLVENKNGYATLAEQIVMASDTYMYRVILERSKPIITYNKKKKKYIIKIEMFEKDSYEEILKDLVFMYYVGSGRYIRDKVAEKSRKYVG